MKPNTPGLDTGSPAGSPDACAETGRFISLPGRDTARGPKERFVEVAKVATEPASTSPPSTLRAAPAISAGTTPLPAPSAAEVARLVDLPQAPEQPFSAFGSLRQFQD